MDRDEEGLKHISTFVDEALREMFEERAAIMEYEGVLPKAKAEALARAEVDSYRRVRESAAADAKVNK